MTSLNLVTLPIGNIRDITIRCLDALKNGEYFFAEDTRVFKKLLQSLEIDFSNKKIYSFHEHSSSTVIEDIINLINSGCEIYLVSDAGSPLISDPAYPLIKKLTDLNINIKTLPGVTSVIAALELSGLPPIPFHFWGFLARGGNEKLEFFKSISQINGTHIFFEAPHRIIESVETIFEMNNELEIVLVKELTKTFETVYRLNSKNKNEVMGQIIDKGEFVILFHVTQNKKNRISNEDLLNLVSEYINGERSPKKLAKIFSRINGEETKAIYQKLI